MSNQNTQITPRVKNKYLRSLEKMLDFTYVGKSFWAADLWLLKNKEDKTSKVLYAFELENGNKLELVDIYNGSIVRINSFSKQQMNISTGTDYQKGIVLDLIFACFVKSIEYKEGTKTGITYTYHRDKNIVNPKDAVFTVGDFELSVFTDRVEILLPNFPNRIVGMYKSIPIVTSPSIAWETVGNSKNIGIFGEDDDNGMGMNPYY